MVTAAALTVRPPAAACTGRAHYSPPDEVSEFRCRRACDAGREVDPEPGLSPDWRITCLLVDRARRAARVVAVAPGGAPAQITAQIAARRDGVVAANPEALTGQRTVAGLHRGDTRGLFGRAGFEGLREIGKNRRVVRRGVAGAGPAA